MQAIYARGKEETNRKSDQPLHINNCGYYRDIDADVALLRPQGRADFHMVFAAEGEIDTDYGRITAGECVLFLPHERQRYTYLRREKSLYYWIHFSGTDAERIFDRRRGGILRYSVNAVQVHELLLRIVRAVSEGMAYADLYAEGLLRAVCSLALGAACRPNPFGKAIAMMRDFSVQYTVKDYAAASGMSEGHFIRAFKGATGSTPGEYRTALQIAQAKNLLVGTSLRIGAIAALSGFSDALYFSRVFKSKTGLSPSVFRKKG